MTGRPRSAPAFAFLVAVALIVVIATVAVAVVQGTFTVGRSPPAATGPRAAVRAVRPILPSQSARSASAEGGPATPGVVPGANGMVHGTTGSAATSVASTLVLANNTTYPGNFGSIDSINPTGIAVDASTGDVYVAAGTYNLATGNLSVVDPSTNKVVGTIPVGDGPQAVVYDPGSSMLFVSNTASDTVTVVNPATESVVASVPVGLGPEGLAYDAGNGYLYVADATSDNVTVVNATSYAYVTAIPLPPASEPTGLAYDPSNALLYVSDYGGSNVTLIDTTSNSVGATVPVGSAPGPLVYDTASKTVYAENEYSSNVSVLSGSTTAVSVLATVSLPSSTYNSGSPNGIAYDPTDGDILVSVVSVGAPSFGAGLVVVDAATNSVIAAIATGGEPSGVAYDPGIGQAYVADNYDSRVVTANIGHLTVGASIWLGSYPAAAAYDPANGYIYVLGEEWPGGAQVVSLVSPTGAVAATVSVEGPGYYFDQNPNAVAYDPANGEMYVGVTDTVVALSGSSVQTTIGGFISVGGIAYDAATGDLYVSDPGNFSVDIVNPASGVIVGYVPVEAPAGIAYDASNLDVYVANGSDSVTVINVDTVVASVPVGFDPTGVAVDAAAGRVYVGNWASDNLSVIDDVSNQVIATIAVQANPEGLALDPTTGDLFVASDFSNTVSIVSTSTESVFASVAVGSSPLGVAYDAANGNQYVTNLGSGSVSIFPPIYDATFSESGLPSGTQWNVEAAGFVESSTTATTHFYLENGTYSFSVGVVSPYSPSPASGSLTVRGGATHVAITFTLVTYGVTFTESGLPSGTMWWLNLTNGQSFPSTTSSLTFSEPNGSYSYSLACTNTLYSAPSGSFSVRGAAFSASVTFSLVTYSLTFSESGLPASTSWSVSLNGSSLASSTATIVFHPTNGSYTFAVGAVSGYTATPASGSLTVSGANVSRAITFAPKSATTYSVTFSEAGLPSGTSWSISLNGATSSSTTSSLSFSETNGTYSFTVGAVAGYTATPSSGSLTVSGAPLTQSITFTYVPPTTYAVTFTQAGLPSGTSWSVTLNGSTLSSSTASIVFQVTNGSYSFAVGAVAGYTATPSSGSLIVSGSPQSVPVTFTAVSAGEYGVTFSEAGLVSGTMWSVTLGSATMSSTSTTIGFSEPNGTYSFSVGLVGGYTAYPANGSLSVVGRAINQAVTFVPGTTTVYPVTFAESGLVSGTSWSVTLNGTTESSANSTVEFLEPNGSYSFSIGAISGYAPSPGTGTVHVTGAAVTDNVTFTQITTASFPVTFTESGLPTGSAWSVTLGGVKNTSTTSSVGFEEANGSLAFAVGTVAGYGASPSSGTVRVAGSAVAQSITFSAVGSLGYALTFDESGLPTGTSWSVTVNGASRSSTTADISFTEPNGSYSFSVTAVSGYSLNRSTGTVTILGTSQIVTLQFTSKSHPGTTGPFGLPGNDAYYLLAALIFLVLIVVGVAIALRRRRSPGGGAEGPEYGSAPAATSPATYPRGEVGGTGVAPGETGVPTDLADEHCQGCGQPLVPGRRFCGSCGRPR